jgi:hypothetical protein
MMNKNYNGVNLDLFKTRDRSDGQIFDSWYVDNKFSVPLINYTLVNERLQNVSECDGAFPRWLASTRLVNPMISDKHTTATAIIGDSRKERDIGVASGFTTYVLQKDEIMVPEDILGVLGLKEGGHIEL